MGLRQYTFNRSANERSVVIGGHYNGHTLIAHKSIGFLFPAKGVVDGLEYNLDVEQQGPVF